METAIDRIVEAFGGLTACSRALGHKNCTTVQGWRDRGSVPSRQIPKVIEAGQSLPKPLNLTPSDFFDESASRAMSAEVRA